MKERGSFKKGAVVCTTGIFLLFFLYLLIQHFQVFFYYDDYGYASLSYAYVQDGVAGTQFTFSQLLHYLGQHYMVWGGRILSFLQEILLYRLGLNAVRVVQSAVLLILFVLLYRMSKKGTQAHPVLFSAFICSLFGLLPLVALGEGVYWFCASVLYVFSTCYLFAGMFLYSKLLTDSAPPRSRARTAGLMAGSMLLLFLSAFSMEQVGLATIVTLVSFSSCMLLREREKKKLRIILPVFVVAAIGFLILMLAPGNSVRKQHRLYVDYYAMSLPERVLDSFSAMMHTFFSKECMLINLLLFAVGVAAAIWNARRGKSLWRWMNGITAGFSAVLFVCTLFQLPFDQIVRSSLANGVLHLIYLIFWFLTLTQFLWERKDKMDLLAWSFLLGGYASMACLVIAPAYVYRNQLFFYFTLFFVTGRMVSRLIQFMQNHRPQRMPLVLSLLFVPVFLVSFVNLVNITLGYYANAPVLQYNQEEMQRAQAAVAQGEDPGMVTLYRIPDVQYGVVEGDGVLVWMREYYNLPPDFPIDYRPYDAQLFAQSKADLNRAVE